MPELAHQKKNSDREEVLRLYKYTKHAEKRMKQRTIWPRHIRQAFCYGKELFRNGVTFFVLDCDSVPGGKDHILIDELEGLVVLIDLRNYEVITVYRSPDPISTIEGKARYWKR